MNVSRAKLRIAKIRKPPKKDTKPELVLNCDCCGKRLRRSCLRTTGSAVCAASSGVFIKLFRDSSGEKWRFYCTEECRTAAIHVEKIESEHQS